MKVKSGKGGGSKSDSPAPSSSAADLSSGEASVCITVKSGEDSRSIRLSGSPDTITIKKFRSETLKAWGWASDSAFRLFYAGRELRDGNSLLDYKLDDGKVVHAATSEPSDAPSAAPVSRPPVAATPPIRRGGAAAEQDESGSEDSEDVPPLISSSRQPKKKPAAAVPAAAASAPAPTPQPAPSLPAQAAVPSPATPAVSGAAVVSAGSTILSRFPGIPLNLDGPLEYAPSVLAGTAGEGAGVGLEVEGVLSVVLDTPWGPLPLSGPAPGGDSTAYLRVWGGLQQYPGPELVGDAAEGPPKVWGEYSASLRRKVAECASQSRGALAQLVMSQGTPSPPSTSTQDGVGRAIATEVSALMSSWTTFSAPMNLLMQVLGGEAAALASASHLSPVNLRVALGSASTALARYSAVAAHMSDALSAVAVEEGQLMVVPPPPTSTPMADHVDLISFPLFSAVLAPGGVTQFPRTGTTMGPFQWGGISGPFSCMTGALGLPLLPHEVRTHGPYSFGGGSAPTSRSVVAGREPIVPVHLHVLAHLLSLEGGPEAIMHSTLSHPTYHATARSEAGDIPLRTAGYLTELVGDSRWRGVDGAGAGEAGCFFRLAADALFVRREPWQGPGSGATRSVLGLTEGLGRRMSGNVGGGGGEAAVAAPASAARRPTATASSTPAAAAAPAAGAGWQAGFLARPGATLSDPAAGAGAGAGAGASTPASPALTSMGLLQAMAAAFGAAAPAPAPAPAPVSAKKKSKKKKGGSGSDSGEDPPPLVTAQSIAAEAAAAASAAAVVAVPKKKKAAAAPAAAQRVVIQEANPESSDDEAGLLLPGQKKAAPALSGASEAPPSSARARNSTAADHEEEVEEDEAAAPGADWAARMGGSRR